MTTKFHSFSDTSLIITLLQANELKDGAVPVGVQYVEYHLEIEAFSQCHGGEFLCFHEHYPLMGVAPLVHSFFA